MSNQPYLPWMNRAGFLRPTKKEEQMNTPNDKPVVGVLFTDPGKPIGEVVTYVDTSGKQHHSKPLMEIDLPELRMFKLLNGDMKVINESYWDEYEEQSQGMDDLERNTLISIANINIKGYIEILSMEFIQEFMKTLPYDRRITDVDQAILDKRIELSNILDELFKEHKNLVGYGHNGHEEAMELQDRYWKYFRGWMKSLLRWKYQSIGFDPDVWCK